MKLFKLFVLIAVIAFLQACKKDAVKPAVKTESVPVVTVTTPATVPVYKFSDMQIVFTPDPGTQTSGALFERYSITKSHICYLQRGTTSPLIVINTNDGSRDTYKVTADIDFSQPFMLDVNETIFYSLSTRHVLSKYSLLSGTAGTVVGSLGKVKAMKSLTGNIEIVTTDSLKGSLIRISSSGAKTVLAQNLGYPGGFDILNNEYYVVNENIINGSILKVAADGTVSTVISNLTNPSKLRFDNNGNMLISRQTTLNSTVYWTYDLYTPAGVFITKLADNTGTTLVSAPTVYGNYFMGIPTEMFVDSFNNLFFYQAIGLANSAIYPAGGALIWKVQMIKQ